MGAVKTMTAYSQLIQDLVAAIDRAHKAGLEQTDVVSALEKLTEIVNEANDL